MCLVSLFIIILIKFYHCQILFVDNNHHNNIVIPRRSSIQQASKLTTDLVLLNNSSSETDKNPPKRHLDNDSVDSAIESRSLSINTPEDGVFEVKSN